MDGMEKLLQALLTGGEMPELPELPPDYVITKSHLIDLKHVIAVRFKGNETAQAGVIFHEGKGISLDEEDAQKCVEAMIAMRQRVVWPKRDKENKITCGNLVTVPTPPNTPAQSPPRGPAPAAESDTPATPAPNPDTPPAPPAPPAIIHG